MAVIPSVPGLAVTVLVHKQPLLEYEPLEDTAQHISNTDQVVVKFIESHNDAPFSVRVSAGARYAWGLPNHALCANLHIDGKYVGNWIFGREGGGVCFEEVTYFDFKKKEWLGRKMRFSAVKIVEEEAKPSISNCDLKHDLPVKAASALGTLTIDIFRGIASDCPRAAEPIGQLDTPMKGGPQMEEKSLKGMSITHQSTFSDPKPVAAPTSIKFEKLREDKGRPIASFKFLYRSRESLVLEGILRSCSPARAISQASVSNTTRQRSTFRPISYNTTRTAQTMPASGIKVKREPAGDDDMDDQDQSDCQKEDKHKPTLEQRLSAGSNPRSIFPNRPRQTMRSAPARNSALPYKTPARRNTSNPSTTAFASHGSSVSAHSSSASTFASRISAPSPVPNNPHLIAVSGPTAASPTTTSSSTGPPSVPSMFLKMQERNKNQQIRAFVAAFSGIPSSTGSPRASSPAIRSSPAVRPSSPLLRRKASARKGRKEAS